MFAMKEAVNLDQDNKLHLTLVTEHSFNLQTSILQAKYAPTKCCLKETNKLKNQTLLKFSFTAESKIYKDKI